MKAWRFKKAQEAFRKELNKIRKKLAEIQGKPFEPYDGRVGKLLRDSTGNEKVSFPSPLLQRLMLRGGYWPMPEGVQP